MFYQLVPTKSFIADARETRNLSGFDESNPILVLTQKTEQAGEQTKPKKVLNRSVLTEKKILHSDERKKNLDLKKLIKAVSKHALMCPGFKKELNKDFLCF